MKILTKYIAERESLMSEKILNTILTREGCKLIFLKISIGRRIPGFNNRMLQVEWKLVRSEILRAMLGQYWGSRSNRGRAVVFLFKYFSSTCFSHTNAYFKDVFSSIDVFSVNEFYPFLSQVFLFSLSKYSPLLMSCPDSKTSSTCTFVNHFQHSILL